MYGVQIYGQMDRAFTLVQQIEGRRCAPGRMLIMLLRHHAYNIKYVRLKCACTHAGWRLWEQNPLPVVHGKNTCF